MPGSYFSEETLRVCAGCNSAAAAASPAQGPTSKSAAAALSFVRCAEPGAPSPPSLLLSLSSNVPMPVSMPASPIGMEVRWLGGRSVPSQLWLPCGFFRLNFAAHSSLTRPAREAKVTWQGNRDKTFFQLALYGLL